MPLCGRRRMLLGLNLLRSSMPQVDTHLEPSKNIKGKYENIKKNAKKKFSVEKQNIYITGGGIPEPVNITNIDEKVKELLGINVHGMVNEFDGDTFEFENMNVPSTSKAEETNWAHWSPKLLKTPISTPLSVRKQPTIEVMEETEEERNTE
ncbi:unnamed protein product [Psylliodes chrysocephalus]|uniref:Uncharacterized protein n=1 Tax=Psylliodes chrysocephalus TaxID=3402493 RepID=A0A9P0G966_9CUCU|nr:unnamed protein product [Psylliodes chrysocephala]